MYSLFPLDLISLERVSQSGRTRIAERSNFDVWTPEYEALLRRDLLNYR